MEVLSILLEREIVTKKSLDKFDEFLQPKKQLEPKGFSFQLIVNEKGHYFGLYGSFPSSMRSFSKSFDKKYVTFQMLY